MDSLENWFPVSFEDSLDRGKSLTAEESCVHLRTVKRLAIYTYKYRRSESSLHGGQAHSVRRTGHERFSKTTLSTRSAMVFAYLMELVEHVRPPRLDFREAEIETISAD